MKPLQRVQAQPSYIFIENAYLYMQQSRGYRISFKLKAMATNLAISKDTKKGLAAATPTILGLELQFKIDLWKKTAPWLLQCFFLQGSGSRTVRSSLFPCRRILVPPARTDLNHWLGKVRHVGG